MTLVDLFLERRSGMWCYGIYALGAKSKSGKHPTNYVFFKNNLFWTKALFLILI